MFKQLSAIALVGLMIHAIACVNPTLASSNQDRQSQRAEEVKSGILKLGVGSDARIALKTRDNVKLAGFISEAGRDSFVVTELKTGTATTVAYGDVTQVKGNNLSTGAKIAIGIGIGVGLTFLVAYLIVQSYHD